MELIAPSIQHEMSSFDAIENYQKKIDEFSLIKIFVFVIFRAECFFTSVDQ